MTRATDRRAFLLGAALAALGAHRALTPLSARAESDVLALLAEPRTHAIMRHALAPGTSDPAHFELGNCSTQRNLDDRGRAQARATGALLRESGVRFDRVLSSRWCRCLETARLMDLGAVEGAPPLDSFFEARHRRAEQTAALHAILRATPAADTLLLVTHQVNITALTGRGTSSGEIVVFRHGEADAVTVLGRTVLRP
ncbi:MAG: histidine phosphatase family protein [Pseudomonadota bacterium]